MIPHNEEFDIFVCEDVLVEVWRGQRVSVARQFGVEWDGPQHSIMHSAVFCPPAGALSDPLPWDVRIERAVRRHGYVWLAWAAAIALGALMSYGMARGWW